MTIEPEPGPATLDQAPLPERGIALDVSRLAGSWKNTNTASRGVVRLDIAPDDHGLLISAQGSAPWGTAKGHAYVVDDFDNAGRTDALAFNTTFDLGFADVRLQANIKAGVLVIVFLTRFHDDSGRSNYFCREFYYRSGT